MRDGTWDTNLINYNINITSANYILFLHQEIEDYLKYLYITLIVIKKLSKKHLTRHQDVLRYKRVD